jgi:hypothetical protein
MGHNLVDDGLGVALPVLGADGMPVKAPRGGLGRWGSTSTPHRGWQPGTPAFFTLADTIRIDGDPPRYPNEALYFGPIGERRGTLGAVCEMCESARIQKIFKLEHPDFDRPLYVGGDCAEYLIGAPSLPIGDVDPADTERVRKIEADAKWYRRLDHEGGAEWNARKRWSSYFDDGGNPLRSYVLDDSFWSARIHGFDLYVKRVGHGWQGLFRHRADDRFARRSVIVPTRELAQRLTRRAALIAKRTQPWKGEAQLADYRAMMAERLKGRES